MRWPMFLNGWICIVSNNRVIWPTPLLQTSFFRRILASLTLPDYPATRTKIEDYLRINPRGQLSGFVFLFHRLVGVHVVQQFECEFNSSKETETRKTDTTRRNHPESVKLHKTWSLQRRTDESVVLNRSLILWFVSWWAIYQIVTSNFLC